MLKKNRLFCSACSIHKRVCYCREPNKNNSEVRTCFLEHQDCRALCKIGLCVCLPSLHSFISSCFLVLTRLHYFLPFCLQVLTRPVFSSWLLWWQPYLVAMMQWFHSYLNWALKGVLYDTSFKKIPQFFVLKSYNIFLLFWTGLPFLNN